LRFGVEVIGDPFFEFREGVNVGVGCCCRQNQVQKIYCLLV